MSEKTVVITGASRGIGKGLADEFSKRGIKLGLCARSMEAVTSDRVVARAVDVTNADAVATFALDVSRELGAIHMWINNAGILKPVGPLRSVGSADFAEHLRINVLGVFHGSQSYVQHVRESGHAGVLVNISSGAGRNGYAGWSAYCAGKAAVDRMSECIALEESDIDLRVHAVAPGVIDTDMQALIRGYSKEQFPMVDRFLQMKAENAFSSIEFVAARMFDLAFDPGSRTDEVLIGFPSGQ